MGNTRYSKRSTLCASLSGRQQSRSPGIWHTEVSFFYGSRHLKGSRSENGNVMDGLVESHSHGVRIRFQHDERNTGPYAPRCSFDAEYTGTFKLVAKIGKAIKAIKQEHGYNGITAERLVEALKATVVEYEPDHYQTYRVSIQPGDSPLVALARQAL